MYRGLTDHEVLERKEKGLVNKTDQKTGKSYKEIILSNTITFFNILNLCFFVLILLVRSYKNGMFMLIILINSVIGIIQEIRTKKTLDKIAIMTADKALLIRNDKQVRVPVSEIVKDDILVLRAGDQIPADAEVLEGELECNESMLTGESDSILKTTGDPVYAGSFVSSGEAVLRVVHVGKENYIETISAEAKKFKKVNSQLRNCINLILRVVSFGIIPLCLGMFAKVYFLKHETIKSAVEQMVTAGIGMIPEGLVLLTSMALTMGVYRLAKKRTIVQELYCIETLARVDVLCLDKTGTLTEGRVKVEKVIPIAASETDIAYALRNLLSTQENGNDTAKGLAEYFGIEEKPWDVSLKIPFSSDRKYSGAVFHGNGSYYMGAQQFLFPEDEELKTRVKNFASLGYRVIVVGRSYQYAEDMSLPEDLVPMGFIVMSDVIRKDCQKTLNFFKSQGVDLKVISGDDPLTVSKIAEKCGLEGADHYIDASTITSKEEMMEALRYHSVFGRVRPEQKKMMVECLQLDHHTVAMTGDGVNDVLALKQADCSIAMASGAEAAKHTANIVLLDSDFSSLPQTVNEGRRVINNICNAASMYLIKTTFSAILSLITIIAGKHYPLQAIQMSMISGFAVGMPTFFLQMEPSFKQIRNNFMQQVFRNAFPAGVVIAGVTYLITNIGMIISSDSRSVLATMCVLSMGWIYFFMLKRIYSPMSTYRKVVLYTMEVLYLIAMIIAQELLELTSMSVASVMTLIGMITLAPILIDLMETLYDSKVGAFVQRVAENSLEKTSRKAKFGKDGEVL